MEVDILAFGAHPDDVECGAGGILARHAAEGYRCGIVDLTAGEMSTNGTVEERKAEASKAAEILNCPIRKCLNLPDAHLSVEQEGVYSVIKVLREFKPRIVLAPFYRDDRHPDHGVAGELVRRAVYLAGLKSLPLEGDAFRPQKLFFFLLYVNRDPDLIVDVSDYYQIKEAAIRAHQTQFQQHCYGGEGPLSLVNDSFFLRFISSRDRYFGSLIGASCGEGVVPYGKLAVADLCGEVGFR